MRSDAVKKRESIERRKALRANVDFFDSNYQRFIEDYPERWVAVRNREVIDSDPDMRELVDRIYGLGVPLRTTLINFVTAKKTKWIFTA